MHPVPVNNHIDVVNEENHLNMNDLVPASHESIGLFDLPHWVLCRICSMLPLRDAKSLGSCCRDGRAVLMDQQTWRFRLWHWGKAINICMVNNAIPNLAYAGAVISDPLLLNVRTLYHVLQPCTQQSAGASRVDVANLLAKLDPSHASNPTLLHQLFSGLAKMFGHKVARHDQSPLQIGEGVNRYMLFSLPETDTAKSLLLSLVASRSTLLETVGLVEGRPGGIGSGVTVRYEPTRVPGNRGAASDWIGRTGEGHLLNLLPLRRVTPKLLTTPAEGEPQRFIQEVAEVVRGLEGIICVLDAECLCHLPQEQDSHPTTLVDGHRLQLKELEAMLHTIPSNRCPVFLILMARDCPEPAAGVDDQADATPAAGDQKAAGKARLHKPYLLKQVMEPLCIPWAAFDVEVNSLSGLTMAINWLVRRTAAAATQTTTAHQQWFK